MLFSLYKKAPSKGIFQPDTVFVFLRNQGFVMHK